MPFTVRIRVTKCDHCPYKIEKEEHHIKILFCPKILRNPEIDYNGILKTCPYNKEDKFLVSISDYVQSKQTI